MKKHLVIGLLAVFFLAGLNGCSTTIFPRKIVFTPELDLAIKNKITEKNLKAPIVLVIGKDGQTFAFAANGKAFAPCRFPTLEEIKHDKMDEAKNKMDRTARKAQESVMESDLPICKGLQEIKGIFSAEGITVMKTKVNPIYILVRTADGMLEQQCTPLPWEPPTVCQ